MAGLSTNPHFDNLPVEVWHLILKQFCQHCRSERMGCAPDVYFDRDADQPGGLCDHCQYGLAHHWYGSIPTCPSHASRYDRYRQDKKALYSLSLVSRTLRGLAQPIMYHLYVSNSNWPQVLCLAGSVTSAQLLLRSGRSIFWGRASHGGTTSRLPLPGSLHVPPALNLGVSRSRVHRHGSWLKESRELSKTSLIANFLTLLPLLEEVSLHEESDFYDDEDFVPSSLQQFKNLPLKSLEVTANAEDRSDRLVPSRLSRLARKILELSTELQTLRLHLFFTLGQPNGYLAHPQVTRETHSFSYTLGLPTLSLRHLQTLHVTDSWLGADEIRYILAACARLREFVKATPPSIQRHRGAGTVSGDPRVPAPQFPHTKRKILCPPAATLLKSLSGFRALRKLLLEWGAICDGCGPNGAEDSDLPQAGAGDSRLLIDLLPENLETLFIVGCTYGSNPARFESALDGLAVAKLTGRFPNLRRLRCDIARINQNTRLQEQRPGYLFNDGDSVRAMFDAAGVEVGSGLVWECRARPSEWDSEDIEGVDYCYRGDDPNADSYMPLPGSDVDDL
ncbi:hypothetical protein PG991_010387 [Apiospora marii]|uniref:F-box domain-containing protein n=1 Tax=Apiospora marii TaxID=335849 RepID=A0ABR1RJ83_9PEZI